MLEIRRPRRVLLLGAAAGLALLGVVASVQAAIPDASGVIHGCYKTNGGNLRVIDTGQGQSCSNSETTLNWNQTGPAGPQGPQGPQGAAGPQGPKGDPGPTYGAGTGLALDGGNFSVLGSYQLPQGCSLGESPFLLGFPASHPWSCFTAVDAGQNCSANNYVTGFGPDGNLNCAAVASPDIPAGPDAYVTRQEASQDTPENADTTLATLSLPNGSFFVNVNGIANNDPDYQGDTLIVHCWFGPRGFSLGKPYTTVHGDGGPLSFSLSDVLTLAAPAQVTLVCTDSEPHSNVENVQMTAVQLGSATTQ
jgi:hypothetical protein